MSDVPGVGHHDRVGWTVSIDTGGTFTDAVARCGDGRVAVAKVPSTPADPSRGLVAAVAALARAGVPTAQIDLVCHGTTVATNAVLTHSLARVALVTTEGFRDVLAYRAGCRPDLYSLTPERPAELVPRDLRLTVRERMTSTGEVLVPLTDDAIAQVVAEVVAAEPEAVAVCLLFGFLDDAHERRLGDALRSALRTALPDVPVTLASEIAREFREYPRTATTVINAALRPLVSGYLIRASETLAAEGVGGRLLVMQSNGGCASAERAAVDAHRLILSGPAGGVAGLVALGRRLGIGNAISLDMGGTSTDVCLMREGVVPLVSSQRIHDHELLAPTVDVHTIGAGGGSIAWIDAAGRLRVGPQSAKALPGPVSYGRGCTQPTLTDAHVVLGTLGSVRLAGDLELDRESAVRAMADLGHRLGLVPGSVSGMSVSGTPAAAADLDIATQAAHMVIAISVAHMVRALRRVSIERGLDPRTFTLVPFGGAGPLHAGLLLRHLQLADAVIPMRPGLFSAEGLLAAGLRVDDAQTVLTTFGEEFADSASRWFEERADALREQLAADGLDASALSLAPSADCRYVGQGFELSVPLAGIDRASISQMAESFHRIHRERYGHASESEQVEVVTIRLAVLATMPAPDDVDVASGDLQPDADACLDRVDIVVPGSERQQVPVWDRARLRAGNVIIGPAVIHQMDATTLLLPGQVGTVLPQGDLRIVEAT